MQSGNAFMTPDHAAVPCSEVRGGRSNSRRRFRVDKEPSSPDRFLDGGAPRWVRWGCTLLLLIICVGLAIYMFAT